MEREGAWVPLRGGQDGKELSAGTEKDHLDPGYGGFMLVFTVTAEFSFKVVYDGVFLGQERETVLLFYMCRGNFFLGSVCSGDVLFGQFPYPFKLGISLAKLRILDVLNLSRLCF